MKKIIRKSPEVRKNEIIDIALYLFLEFGYEKVTMNDIAIKSGIAKSLCYHYFPSKEDLYQEAFTNFVDKLTEDFLYIIKNRQMTLEQRINQMATVLPLHKEKTLFYDFSRRNENKDVYREILKKLFNNLIPYLTDEYIFSYNLNEISQIRVETLMSFILFGQINILTEKNNCFEEQLMQIKEYIDVLLQYEIETRGV